MTMKKTIILILACVCIAASASAQRGSGRLSLGVGLLYKNGMDATLAYEHEINYRHAWEFFANGYLQWARCASCNISARIHSGETIAPTASVWPTSPVSPGDATTTAACRIGASAGSDTRKFLGGLHFGYEHNYALRAGWTIYWQVKSDVMIKGADVLRAGIVLGVKLPVK